VSKRGRTSPAKSAASRRNGARGGRPRKVKVTTEQIEAAAEVLALRRIVTERAANVQFLVDLRDGLMPGATVQDRVRAVESLLDRDPQTARVGREERMPDTVSAPVKRFEIAPGPAYSAPDGWEAGSDAPAGRTGLEQASSALASAPSATAAPREDAPA